MSEQDSFFAWQRDVLGWLLGWGIGSVVVGAGLATDQRPFVRQIGWQAITWGAIDAALALGGRRGARQRLAGINTDDHPPNEAAARFQRILAINAGLDLLYIAGGWWLRRDRRPERQGMGVGIIIQGLFLLIYDSLLTWRSARWRS